MLGWLLIELMADSKYLIMASKKCIKTQYKMSKLHLGQGVALLITFGLQWPATSWWTQVLQPSLVYVVKHFRDQKPIPITIVNVQRQKSAWLNALAKANEVRNARKWRHVEHDPFQLGGPSEVEVCIILLFTHYPLSNLFYSTTAVNQSAK